MPAEIFPDYGLRMRQVREAIGLSLRAVVRAGGPTRAVVTSIEAGNIPGPGARVAITSVYRARLGVTEEELPAGSLTRWALTGDDPPEAIRNLLEGR